MADNVVPLRGIPTASEMETLVHELSADTKNILFDSPHFQQRLRQRGLSIRQVLEVLRKGCVVSGPTQDQYGDWRVKLKRLVAGRRVQVVVAIKTDEVVVVTAI